MKRTEELRNDLRQLFATQLLSKDEIIKSLMQLLSK